MTGNNVGELTAQMTETTDNLALLRRALDQMSQVIGRIRPDQAGLPTPCADWDVRELARHVIKKDVPNYIAVAGAGQSDWQSPPDELDGDWREQFDTGAAQLLAAWEASDPGQTVALPTGEEVPLRSRADQQTAEFTVHSWDLATATGQPVDDLDPQIAAFSLSWSKRMLRPEARGPGKPFGLEVYVPDFAPIYDRLVGWFGRDPAWPKTSAGMSKPGG